MSSGSGLQLVKLTKISLNKKSRSLSFLNSGLCGGIGSESKSNEFPTRFSSCCPITNATILYCWDDVEFSDDDEKNEKILSRSSTKRVFANVHIAQIMEKVKSISHQINILFKES